ncbi:MAG: bifunctional 4'-phosphopantothenoylcysteine decarboxylase/phosphopantothenoylcysteine synthetase, partial [Deltaproteobacteria bacterium HGW-Deltaproteobacteria-7]
MLTNKKIVLGITGGIAAYKAAELIRTLVKEGALVKVMMTKSAMEFITPLTMQTLSRNQVYTDMFVPADQYDMA